MKQRSTLFILLSLVLVALAACDSSTPPAPAATPTATTQSQAGVDTHTPTPASQPGEATIPASSAAQDATPTGRTDAAVVTQPPTPVEDQPTPTAVTATGSGADITALDALIALIPKALAWQPDARLALLADTRPGQQKNLLGSALGDPNINEPTLGGKGRNWTLVAVSPSTGGAVAISMDGTQVDLVKEGAITDDVVARFTGDQTAALALSALDPTKMVDSDKIVASAGPRGQAAEAGVALLSPDGLGLGPLPTPAAGGAPTQIAYELVSSQQNFIIFDAITGAMVMDMTSDPPAPTP